MSFQVGIGSLGGTLFFSSETFYPSANYDYHLDIKRKNIEEKHTIIIFDH